MAGIFALKDAFKKAGPILLEPIMKVEVHHARRISGRSLGDINRRRGTIISIEAKNGQTILNAEVPLAEMFGYATAIRSLSKGRASYSMEPSHFEQVPEQRARRRFWTAAKEPAAAPNPRSIVCHDRTTHSHPTQGLRPPGHRPVGPRHRGDRQAHRRPRRRPDPAADPHRDASPSTARRTSTRSRRSRSKRAPTSACSTSSSRPPRRWTN